TASKVASRLARASSSPLDFQGAHSVLGSASHSGFGREPAIVVGNSIERILSFSVNSDGLLPCPGRGVHGVWAGWNAPKAGGRIEDGLHLRERRMIDLYYAPTPNGWKISIMLEELGVHYTVMPVNIRAGEQFRPKFL